MKLNLERTTGSYTIRGYAPGSVTVRMPGPEGVIEELRESCVLTADRLIRGWVAGPFEALTVDDFARLAPLAPELVLFGSGPRLRFPPPALLAPLARAGIGVEVMDTGAACRTYNVLLAEGRAVAAALLVQGQAG